MKQPSETAAAPDARPIRTELPDATGIARRAAAYLAMIKVEHTLFAMPFAILGGLLAERAAGRCAGAAAWFWIILCVAAARTAAMSVNRIADAALDARNPRTSGRAIPAGVISKRSASAVAAVSGGVFVLSSAMLRPVCLWLSPALLAVVLGYSYAKRFTVLSHAWLGLALGLAPAGAWLAVSGGFGWPPLLLGAAVTLWTAGFDIIYACQDVDVDRREGLHSLPARLGVARALAASAALHAAAIALLGLLPLVTPLGGVYLAGLAVAAGAIVYQHAIVRPGDLSRANTAFFTANGFVSVGLMAAGIIDLLT